MNKVLNLRSRGFVPVGLIALAAAVLLAPAPASATPYVVKVVQQGSNVVATGSGEFDLSGLTFYSPVGGFDSAINPQYALIALSTSGGSYAYSGFSGPSSFGSGGYTGVSSTGGDAVVT